MKYQCIIKQRTDAIGEHGFHTRQKYIAHICAYLVEHQPVGLGLRGCIVGGDKLVVLCGNHNRMYAYRLITGVVLYSNLALGIRAQIGHLAALPAYFSKLHKKNMAEIQRQRHIVGSLVDSESKHHALVACTLVFLYFAVDSAVDVGALFVEGRQDAACIAVKAEVAAVISYVGNHLAGHSLQVDVCFGIDFPGDNYLTGGDKSLACHLRLRVLGKELVEYGVAYLVGNLVGMTLGHRFRREEIMINIHIFKKSVVLQNMPEGQKKSPSPA